MDNNNDFTERRQHERASVTNIVIGILNSDEPVAIGLINDISLGGVNYTHELRMSPNENPIQSIDLIVDGDSLMIDIPCKFVWDVELKRKSFSDLTNLRQCGIQFGKLSPNQVFLLQSIIKQCTASRTKSPAPNTQLSFSE